MSNMAGVLLKARTGYPSRAHGFTPVFGGIRVTIFLVFCVVFCLSLSSVLCAQCYQFLWIVHSFLIAHYNIPTNHNVHINHIHIIHENIKMLALGTETQPINKSIKITQHNMNTLCGSLRFPPAVTICFT
jgi:hypothetical protein